MPNTDFSPYEFKSDDSKKVIQYVREKYKNELKFLWKKFPNNAVFKRQDSRKWYAAMLYVQKSKIGLKGNEMVEVIDVRENPDTIKTLVDRKKYLPGFHMNKKHWITICLDGSVPIEEIYKRIDKSFGLSS